ncbi:putative GTPase activating protein for Arf [Novymonas esmeraldas]|uniref:GTPase activating protein for Arf n=1 Tax=Novymonas esmeraldas TaxID=1808958 RepID=A0AAW0ETY9_9TRYP
MEQTQLTAAPETTKERRHRRSDAGAAAASESGHHQRRHGTSHSTGEKKRKKSATGADAAAVSASPTHRDADGGDGAEDWEENRAAVERLCARHPNNICADCGETGTRWASVNHGVFICIRCSGVHRSLGVHISKVKSTNMDRWSLAEVRLMEAVGNATARTLYEVRLPPGARPASGAGATADDAVKSFIHRKYADRAFAVHNVRDMLARFHKDTGYGRPPKVVKSSHGHGNSLSSSTRGSGLAVAAPLDRAAVAGQRGDTMRALYGDAAAEMQQGPAAAARRRRGDKDASAQPAVTAPTYGAFGLVNVPPEEHEARWQRTLAVFAHVTPAADVEAEEGGDSEGEAAPAPAAAAVGAADAADAPSSLCEAGPPSAASDSPHDPPLSGERAATP